MSIAPGTRLGPYEVVAPLGAGGMGEVFKARDTRLDRSVAIKVLPADFAENAQLKMRFEREAKTISQLNHPHICTLFDVGDGYLVMELLEGETLASRLSRGPLPIDQVVRYGIEIAEALEKAHRAGVVHRDLKPGNIMITKSGAKLLDFGLAKPNEGGAISALTSLRTEHKNLTEEGAIVGTFQYMAPEQLEGGEVDARTDIFAFGAVLYEMVTGKHAFEGKSKASLIASILTIEPPAISAVQPMTPASLDRVVRTCLRKDADERWQSAHDVAIELRAIGEAAPQRRRETRTSWIAVAVIAALAALAAAFASMWYRATSAPKHRIQAAIVPPENTEFSFVSPPALSPDGTKIAFTALPKNDARAHLYVRDLANGATHDLSQSGLMPFWSPDGRSIGFFDVADRKLKRIDAGGGPAQAVADIQGRSVSGSWNRDGVILFSPGGRHGLSRIAAAGGSPVEVTKLEAGETWHRWPWFLPDGKHFLYVAQAIGGVGNVYVGSLDGGEKKLIGHTALSIQYSAADGLLLFCRERSLVAQPFDLKKLELRGEPTVITDDIFGFTLNGSAAFSVSNTGIAAFAVGNAARSQLVWRDRSGKQLGVIGEPADYQRPSLAHDGRHVAYEVFAADGKSDIWIYDMVRKTAVRFTSEPGSETNAVWSPDDRYIAYSAENPQTGARDIVRRGSSGAGLPEKLVTVPGIGALTDWSSDGKYIFFHDGQDIFAYSFTERKVFPVVHTPFNESAGRLSPDGHWLAFASEQSGHVEVYVQPFPNPTFVAKISTNGGTQPRWTMNGREVIYETIDHKVWSVDIHPGPTFEAGDPKQLFTYAIKPGGWALDVSSDGQRFLINESLNEASNTPLTLVVNFSAPK